MERRACGGSGLSLPLLGVGCWSFGGGEYWGAQDQREADGIVSAAIDNGCSFFDTAEGYNDGRSEEALGRALRGKRDKALIASKISPDHCAPGQIRLHCEASLSRLATDCIDIYMLHWPLNPLAIRHFSTASPLQSASPRLSEVLVEMEELRAQGKIRHVGVSNFGAAQLAETAGLGVTVVCNEVPYSLLSRAIEWDIIPACSRDGIGVLGYMPLMQGLLTGSYASADHLPPNRARTRHFRGDRPGSRHGEPGHEKETFETVRALGSIAAREGHSLETLAIAWSVARPALTCTITGARNPAQLEANARAASLRLDPAVVAEMDAVSEGLKGAMGKSVDLFESSDNSRTR
jgi:myo-inositol catabolism protein IolS